jgi:hypothetical protein
MSMDRCWWLAANSGVSRCREAYLSAAARVDRAKLNVKLCPIFKYLLLHKPEPGTTKKRLISMVWLRQNTIVGPLTKSGGSADTALACVASSEIAINLNTFRKQNVEVQCRDGSGAPTETVKRSPAGLRSSERGPLSSRTRRCKEWTDRGQWATVRLPDDPVRPRSTMLASSALWLGLTH